MKKYLLLGTFMIIGSLLLIGCGSGSSGGDQPAKVGDTVSVHYTGTLEDGTQFDSSIGKTPLTFTIGSGQVIPGFDNAVRGMKVGDIKTVTLPPEEAYGPHRDDLIAVLGRDQFPEGLTFTVGQRIPLQDDLGRQLTATIIEIGPSSITVDANHELAGKALIFEIELVSITPVGN